MNPARPGGRSTLPDAAELPADIRCASGQVRMNLCPGGCPNGQQVAYVCM